MRKGTSEKYTSSIRNLTLWYSLIISIILISFSTAIYFSESRDFRRIIVQEDFGNTTHIKATVVQKRIIASQVKELRDASITNIIIIDIVILGLSSFLSFFLAKMTLMPIEEASEKQKEFIADVSHELRTPIAAIELASEIVLRNKESDLSSYKRVVEQTHSEVIRLKKMTENLLTLAKSEYWNESLEMQKVNLSVILIECINNFEETAKSKRITFKKNIDQNVFIKADKDKLKELIIILLDNSIKYNKENGLIDVMLHSKDGVEFIVKDTGIGISSESKKHIFERMYQEDTARSFEGAGLGLSIAKKIADIHGATIHVESVKGEYSIFTVNFNQR